MAFLLKATTCGDELIPSQEYVVAESDDRSKLEKLMETRAKERADYLEHNSVTWYQQCAIISHETIVEVPSV